MKNGSFSFNVPVSKTTKQYFVLKDQHEENQKKGKPIVNLYVPKDKVPEAKVYRVTVEPL